MSSFLPMLLAQHSRGDSLSEGFRSHGGMGRDEVLLGLLMVSALVAGIWAVSRMLGLRHRQRGLNNPWQLFKELCKAHHLNWSDSWLLRRVARHLGLRDPARLFLEADRWEEQTLGAAFALEFVRLRVLRKQLFDAAQLVGTAAPPPASEPAMRRVQAKAASPLFPNIAAPTLDVPPWTESQSVER